MCIINKTERVLYILENYMYLNSELKKSSPPKHEVHGSILGLLILVRRVERLEPVRCEGYADFALLRHLILVSIQIYYERMREKKVMSHNIWLGGRVSACAAEILPLGASPGCKNTVGVAIHGECPRLVYSDPMLDTISESLEGEVRKVEKIAPIKIGFSGLT